jgi:hypothetical protein
MWITGACCATACVGNAIRVKHNEVRGNPARVILRNMVVSIVLMDGPQVGARMRRIGCSRAETFSSDAHFVFAPKISALWLHYQEQSTQLHVVLPVTTEPDFLDDRLITRLA